MNYEILSLETARKLKEYDDSKKKSTDKTPTDWNLDFELIVWLNKNLKTFYNNAGEVVDLTYHKFEYKGKMYTQERLLEMLIKITDYLKKEYYEIKDPQKVIDKANEMFEILKLIFFTLWW